MKTNEINIRDPFILKEGNKYYLYGTRAANFGTKTGGFDVYISYDMDEWSGPYPCFNSEDYNMNNGVNWAPEVHKYDYRYFMFATFTKDNGLRGTYILISETPTGPFMPHSEGAVTPYEWECLDGTFYRENGKNYLVFCHEHTQITDGTICYVELDEKLYNAIGKPVTLFAGSEPYYIEKKPEGYHYITDGPFMYRTEDDVLLMLWSTCYKDNYAECLVRFKDGLTGPFEHLDPIFTEDGGHGMLLADDGKLYFTYHSPNSSGKERVQLTEVVDKGLTIELK